MPPPNSGLDPWMAGRHFGVVIDAGSSGSRLQIYSWTDPKSSSAVKGSELEFTLPNVKKGTEKGEDWVTKVEPEEEGLFGWIMVNYLMNGFMGAKQKRMTYGFLDMGSVSMQITFEPGHVNDTDTKNLIDVQPCLMGGQEIMHKVFVTTWLGYGTNQAWERYVGKVISDFETSCTDSEKDIVHDPCLPKGLELTEKPVHGHLVSMHTTKAHKLIGTGTFKQCIQKTAPLMNKTAPCLDTPCLMNGIHVPPIDFSVSQFIGISEYWYSSEHIFGLRGAYDFVQYEHAAAEFCSRPWDGIMKQHELSKTCSWLGGDDKVVAVGQWHPSVECSRLEMQCFKAAWISNVLHEGIGIPRLTVWQGLPPVLRVALLSGAVATSGICP
ncbi:hypothetical protein DXG01_015691 [Tephrocybe rancida]|nr:hypothetical protein DXG01_015691 [Tephrocybe rancida]